MDIRIARFVAKNPIRFFVRDAMETDTPTMMMMETIFLRNNTLNYTRMIDIVSHVTIAMVWVKLNSFMNLIMTTAMNRDMNTPLWQLTIGEFIELQKKVIEPVQVKDFTVQSDKRYVYGLAGLAKLFGCSKRSASALKSSGKINKAITQDGRKIVIDADLALELARKNK